MPAQYSGNLARALVQWLVLGAVVGVAAGLASAAFLGLLEFATKTREANLWIVFTLPLAGLVLGGIYAKWGGPIRGGNNLVIETFEEGSRKIPLRMAPMVLVGTVLTHLFGGSAGREGTAVQMGASLADEVAHRFGVTGIRRTQLLCAGIAGGFGAVFGTPIAGTIFGMEVTRVGRLEYDALLPSLTAAVVGDLVVRSLGVGHTHYPAPPVVELTPLLIGKWIVFGLVVAAVTVVFIEGMHLLKATFEKRLPMLPARMAVGGAIVVLLWQLVGTSDYLGLGIPMIVRAFEDPQLPVLAFAAKLLFTAVTLSAGFLGGEVTPLFFVGATLGNVLGRAMDIPISLAAGVGLAALFGAAANTPLALTVMAVELLGASVLPHVAIVAVVAYLLTGHRGIYPSQRLVRFKHGGPLLERWEPLSTLRRGPGRGAKAPESPR